jgi:Skp family chaperone for outer membrane proteins
MKRILTAAVVMVFAAFLTVSASAQVQPATKIGWIVTGAFGDEKEGITKYVAAEKALDLELKPKADELRALQTRIKTISDDLAKMQAAGSSVPVDVKAAQAKQDEGARLQREFEFKQKEAQAYYAKRREEVLGPLSQQIFQALQDYAKQKGYAVIIDISTLGQPDAPSPVVFLDPAANVTKDFVTYYNSRPATTATTTTPKP